MSKNRIIRSEDFSGKAPAIQSPTDIADIYVWLDAQDVNGNGTNPADAAEVLTWSDKSGNGNDFNAIGGAGLRPIYDEDGFNSLPGVDIDATQHGIRADAGNSLTTSNEFTMFLVMNQRGPASNGFYPIDVNTPRFVAWFNTTAGGAYFQTAFQETNVQTSGDNIFTLIGSAGSLIRRDNGVQVFDSSAMVAQNMGNTLTFGSRFTGETITNFEGIYAEIIIYERRLQAFEVEQVEKYLTEKWGL